MSEHRSVDNPVFDETKLQELPELTQWLYFNFVRKTDDEGFVKGAKGVAIGCGVDDYKTAIKELEDAKYIYCFDKIFNVVLVRHHWTHNTNLAQTRLTPTSCTKEKAKVDLCVVGDPAIKTQYRVYFRLDDDEYKQGMTYEGFEILKGCKIGKKKNDSQPEPEPQEFRELPKDTELSRMVDETCEEADLPFQ